MATTAEAEKRQPAADSAQTPDTGTWTDTRAPGRHGWPSRLRSYFILTPLIWSYTLVLGTISLIWSLFDRSGRIQHALARLWSQAIMKTILSPVKVTGMEHIDPARPNVY